MDQGHTFLKVVVMGNFLYPKGMAATQRLQLFIESLVDDKIPVEVILLRQGSANKADIQRRGVHKGVPYQTIGKDIGLSLSLLWTFPAFFIQGMKALKQARNIETSVLYLYDGFNVENIFFVLWAKILGYKIVVDIVENYEVLDEELHLLGRWKNNSILWLDRIQPRWVDGFVVISGELEKKYEKMGLGNTPMSLIPISAYPNKQVHAMRNSPIRIIYAGSYAVKDGVGLLIDAFLELIKTQPDCRLFLMGKGRNRVEFEKKYEGHSHIEFVGYLDHDEFYQTLREADILCVPRTNSAFANTGFPFKLGEYLATGKPVVVSDTGDVGEYLQDRVHAMVVPPSDSKAIQKALTFLVENPEEAEKIGMAGATVCEANFHPEKNYQKLKRLLYKIARLPFPEKEENPFRIIEKIK